MFLTITFHMLLFNVCVGCAYAASDCAESWEWYDLFIDYDEACYIYFLIKIEILSNQSWSWSTTFCVWKLLFSCCISTTCNEVIKLKCKIDLKGRCTSQGFFQIPQNNSRGRTRNIIAAVTFNVDYFSDEILQFSVIFFKLLGNCGYFSFYPWHTLEI